MTMATAPNLTSTATIKTTTVAKTTTTPQVMENLTWSLLLILLLLFCFQQSIKMSLSNSKSIATVNFAAIIGGSIGGLVVVIVLIAVLIYCVVSRYRNTDETQSEMKCEQFDLIFMNLILDRF